MADILFIEKKIFPKENNPDGRLAYVVGQRPVSTMVREFAHSDDPYAGMQQNFGYFGFTPQIEGWVKENTKGHIALGDCRGVNELYGTAKGKTAIIAGSSRAILDVRDSIPPKGDPVHDNLVVFALNAAGVALGADKVDYLFALDYSARIEWYPEEFRHLPIILSFNCPDLLGTFFKERYYFASVLREDADMRTKYGFLDCGNIASYSCAHMAFKMGVKRIIWVGHEFAYTPDAGRIWNHWNEPMTMEWRDKHQVGFAADYHGNPVPSDERLAYNARIVAAISYMCGDQGIEVINATGRGLLGIRQEPEREGAAGVYTMGFKEALERISPNGNTEEACPAGVPVHDVERSECFARS